MTALVTRRDSFAKLDSIDDLNEFIYHPEVQRRVAAWTSAHHVACPAVNDVAAKIVGGCWGPEGAVIWTVSLGGETGNPVEELDLLGGRGIHAHPFEETFEEFLGRAGRHYKEVKTRLIKAGYQPQAVKRDRDHFRYLAAHLLGGYSFAEIADGETGFRLLPSKKSPKTVAGEARKVAQLIGIELPKAPGPRRGSRRRRR